MQATPPPLVPTDPTSLGIYLQWCGDRLLYLSADVAHLHKCVEDKAKAEREARVKEYAEAEEINESRHGQNIDAIGELGAKVNVFNSFMENLKADERVQLAVAADRQNRKQQDAERSARHRDYLFTAGKLLTLPSVAVVVKLIASLLGVDITF